MAKNKQQDQTFEEILKAQQMEMLDSEEEDNFQCTQNSGKEEEAEEEELAKTTFLSSKQQVTITMNNDDKKINDEVVESNKEITEDLAADEDFRCTVHSASDNERPTAEIEFDKSKNMAESDDEDKEDCKSISSTDEEEEIDSSAAVNELVIKIVHLNKAAEEQTSSNLENDEEEAKDSSEPFSIEIIMNSSYDDDDESGDEELKEQQIESAANITAKKVEIENVKEEMEAKKLTTVDGSATSTNNSNVVNSEDFKGIRDLDQLFSEGLPKPVLNKIKLINHKYTTEELRKIRKNRNAEQWKDYLWKNHGCDWPVADEPFELDPELRVPYWKKLQIRRQREDEARRWHGILGNNNTSNAATFSKTALFVEQIEFSPVREFYPSKNSNNNKGITVGGKQQSSSQFGQPPIHVQKSGHGQQQWTLPFNRFSNCQHQQPPISQGKKKKKNKKKKGNGNNANAAVSPAMKKAPIEDKEQQKLNKAEKKQLAAEMDWTDSSDEGEEFSDEDEDEEKTCTDEEWASAISDFDKQGNEGTTPQKQKESPQNCLVECVPSNSAKQIAKREKRKRQKEKARLQREKNAIAIQQADQSTSNDFPYSSPPHIQAQWVQSQPLFQSYIAGVNKVIQELSATTI